MHKVDQVYFRAIGLMTDTLTSIRQVKRYLVFGKKSHMICGEPRLIWRGSRSKGPRAQARRLRKSARCGITSEKLKC
jgi:hypothetical protein